MTDRLCFRPGGIMLIEAQGYCGDCNRNVLVRAHSPNHLAHFLTVIVSGILGYPWLLLLACLGRDGSLACGLDGCYSICGSRWDSIPLYEVWVGKDL